MRDPTARCLPVVAVALAIFLQGFLDWDFHEAPAKPDIQAQVKHCPVNPNLPVEKLVFVVIDAWRFDFLSQRTEMTWMRGELEANRADAFDMAVYSPTVTMPRIKALTTGDIPSFWSILLNFGGSGGSGSDSWIRAAREAGKKIIFYGDDTWLSLYGSELTRSEGVVSFFVKDYTEVDNNVTRQIGNEFAEQQFADWDVLILHYLGLDHIGHSLGGSSGMIGKKLAEMDAIISDIAGRLEKQTGKYALLVVGDHGMTEAGGHGGSSVSETHVPLFVKIGGVADVQEGLQKAYASIDQVDVADFASLLLGIRPISTSIGVPIHYLLNSRNLKTSTIGAWLTSAEKLIARLASTKYEDAQLHACARLFEKLSEQCQDLKPDDERICGRALRDAQSHLIRNSSSLDLTSLCLSLTMSAMVSLYLAGFLWRTAGGSRKLATFCGVSALHFLSYFASSLVEEEHDIWYFLLGSLLVVECLSRVRAPSPSRSIYELAPTFLIFVVHRANVALYSENRRRNLETNGTYPPAFTTDPEVFGTILKHLPAFLPSIFPVLIFIGSFARQPNFRDASVLIAAALSIFANSELTDWMPYIWALALLVTLFKRDSLGMLIWAVSLCHPGEAAACLGCYYIGKSLKSAPHVLSVAIPAAFFYMGNSNSIASIDIATGYAGMAEYQPLLVGAQILLHCYAGVIALLVGFSGGSSVGHWPLLPSLLFTRTTSLTGSLISLLVFRQHLFVWSVFAPKILYECTHFMVFVVMYAFARFLNK
ncbi:unnamed protein product, partial [Mesorhabditis spiculigera]